MVFWNSAGFSNTAKRNPNKKTHLRSVLVSETPPSFSSVKICQPKRLTPISQSIIRVFGHNGNTWPSAESPDRVPRRNAHYTCTVKGRQKSRMRTTYQNKVWDSGIFAHALFFVPKDHLNVMGFSGSVNGTTKNPGFFYFGFCQCKWAYFCPIDGSKKKWVKLLKLAQLLALHHDEKLGLKECFHTRAKRALTMIITVNILKEGYTWVWK